jgi:proline iminopeptidase
MRLLGVFLLLAALAAPAAAENRAALAPGEHQVVINDVRLWYRVAGRTRGIPVVFLHGGPGQGSQTFARFAGPPLERGLRMVYLDQRGSGRSERPWTNAYSVDLIVEDLEQLRRHWGSESIALIGHSFGSVIAMEYAAKYPRRVSRLVLSGAAPDVPAALDLHCARLERQHPDIYAQAVARLPQGSQRRCNVFAAPRSFIDGGMYPNPETMRLVDETDASGGMRNTGEIGRAVFAQGFLDYRFARPERLTMPVLVIHGASDFQAVVEPQRALVSRVPGARLIEYEGRGHFMFVEEPERFARDVIEFVRGNPRR